MLANKFVDVATQIGLNEKTNSRGGSMTDLNNDGKLDLVVTHMFSRPSIYKNTMKAQKSWIGFNIESKTKGCNAEAIGSIVTIEYMLNGKTFKQMREKVAVNGFNAQSENRIHFGLGDYKGAVKLNINWCNKEKRDYSFNSLNKYHRITY